VEPPEIQYVKCGGRDVAYQALGSGAVPFVGYFEIGAHLDLMWTDPAWVQQAERFSGLWRVAFFQMRGIGLSEPVDRRPTLEEQASDIAAVMDAAGMPRAQVIALGATAPGAVVFAASYPDRVDGLVLVCPYLSMPLADDPDLTGWEPGAARRFADWWLENVERWGSGIVVDGWDPAIASPRNYRQLGPPRPLMTFSVSHGDQAGKRTTEDGPMCRDKGRNEIVRPIFAEPRLASEGEKPDHRPTSAHLISAQRGLGLTEARRP
jgi:pimeloyl-ACP methyl ester carboxylesterase